MKTIIAPLAALAAYALGVSVSSAASPTYCALFAKEFVEQASQGKQSPPSKLVHDRAYHKCLNLDEEPQLPTAYRDPTTDGNGAQFAVEEKPRAEISPVPELMRKPTTPDRPAANTAPVEETAALRPEATAAPREPEKSRLRSWMDGFIGKFRRTPTSPPPSSSEVSVLGDRALTMSAAERAAHCAKYFPKSYDPRTGTVIPYKTGVRTKC